MSKLDTTILLRLTKEDKEIIVKYCNEHDYIISKFIRRAIINTIKNNIEKENKIMESEK